MLLDDDYTIRRSSNMVPLVAVCYAEPGRRFVIDKFALSKSQARTLVAGQNAGHNSEGKAAKEIADFLRR